MRNGLINKAEKLPIAIDRVRLGAGCPFFPPYYQAENFYCRFSEGGDLTTAERLVEGSRKARWPGQSPAMTPNKWFNVRGGRGSLAGQPQRRAPPGFATAQALLGAQDIVAGDRHRALALGQLNLEHHHILASERRLGAGEIEFPH